MTRNIAIMFMAVCLPICSSALAAPTIAYNGAAQKFVEMANENAFLSQTDRVLRDSGLRSDGGESDICVSASYRNIEMTLNALREHPVDLGDAVSFLQKIIAEASVVAKAHDLDVTDVRNGTYPWVILSMQESDILKRRNLKSNMIDLLTMGPADQLIEAALASPKRALMEVAVTVKAQKGFNEQHHAIVILGIDRAKKLISYSDPMEPNSIATVPYTLDREGRWDVLHLPMKQFFNMIASIGEAWSVELADK